MAKATTKSTKAAKNAPTKKDQLIRVLKAKAGADVAMISDKLGWQPHTTRAAMTGLRKAGQMIVAAKLDGGGASKYRIVGTTAKDAGAEAENAGAF